MKSASVGSVSVFATGVISVSSFSIGWAATGPAALSIPATTIPSSFKQRFMAFSFDRTETGTITKNSSMQAALLDLGQAGGNRRVLDLFIAKWMAAKNRELPHGACGNHRRRCIRLRDGVRN